MTVGHFIDQVSDVCCCPVG